MSGHSLDDVVAVFGVPDARKTSSIMKAQVVSWLNADDLAVVGATYALLARPQNWARVTPPPIFEDLWPLFARYFERCFVEDRDGDWILNRYEAGWELARIIGRLAQNDSRTALQSVKQWLARVYIAGDERLRTCIVNATLEHVFENRAIRVAFQDWTKHPVLGGAYKLAAQWSDKGGSTEIAG